MTDPAPRAPRRISSLKLAGLIAAILALLIATYAAYIHSVADRRWAAMEKSVEEVRALSDRRNGPRPVLRGDAVPGNAWEDYAPALLVMKGAPSGVLGEAVTRGPKTDRVKVDAALVTYAAALDGLRKGVRRADGHFQVKWEQGFSTDIPGLLQSQNLANLAVCRSRILVEEGKPREAAELMLDLCQFAHDLGYNEMLISEMIAIAICSLGIDELRDLILRGQLSKEDLQEISRELEILDVSFPRNGHSMMNEAMALGYEFLKSGDSFDMSNVTVGGGVGWNYFLWRAVFPSRLISADAYFIELDYMKQFAAADETSWSACEAVGTKAQIETTKLRNPIAQLAIPGLTGSNRAGRERRTNLRLLRAAAHYRVTGALPELEDPFGGKLLSSEKDGKVKVWSVGRDRVDDGGKGDWKPNPGPDIVLEFDK